MTSLEAIVLRSRVNRAEVLGCDAFHNARPRSAAVSNDALIDMIYESPSEFEIELCRAWYRGWDAAQRLAQH